MAAGHAQGHPPRPPSGPAAGFFFFPSARTLTCASHCLARPPPCSPRSHVFTGGPRPFIHCVSVCRPTAARCRSRSLVHALPPENSLHAHTPCSFNALIPSHSFSPLRRSERSTGLPLSPKGLPPPPTSRPVCRDGGGIQMSLITCSAARRGRDFREK